MHHLTCEISSFLRSVNLILFTALLVHLILSISPHHSHHLCCHHLSLPRSFTPDLKLISFTNRFLHNHSYCFRTASRHLKPVLNNVGTGVCFSFFFIIFVWLSDHLACESTLNSSFVSYRTRANFKNV